jgi:hypothetical protein
MEIKELLNSHREYYLEYFFNLITKSEAGESELLIKNNNEEQAELYRLYRYDLVSRESENSKFTEFNTDGFLNHDKIDYFVEDKIIEFSPIVWNGVEISYNDTSTDFDSIEKWAFKWLDINDCNKPDSNNLQQVIHNITKAELVNGWNTFSVDFGSAPIEAAIELIEIILNLPLTTKIKLESKWITNQ